MNLSPSPGERIDSTPRELGYRWLPRQWLLDHMGCQAGVGAANLTTMITDDKTETSKSYDTIKLGIDAHAK